MNLRNKLIILLLTITGCTFFLKEDKTNIRIIAKYTVWQGEKNGVRFVNCHQNKITEFRKMDEYDCYFYIGDFLFSACPNSHS